MTSEIARPRVALLTLLTALTVALFAGGSPAQAASCSGMPHYPSSKGGYFLSLRVTKLSCTAGKSLMRSHYHCRVTHGIRGRCTRVRGYTCSERRGAAIPTEFNAEVTCKRGSRRFVYAYQQNT